MTLNPATASALKQLLLRSTEVNITVIGRKSGRAITIPVWFVLDKDRLCLLPVNGSDTQWYKNLLKSSALRIDAGGHIRDLRPDFTSDSKRVISIVKKFQDKYGATNIRKYYANPNVAVTAELP
jgi:hypothetical protein